MIKKLFKLLFSIIFLLAMQNIQVFCASVGTSGGQFLKINVDSKSSSLGGTMATSDGVESIFLNPAGLVYVENMQIGFSQIFWIEDIAYTNAAFAKSTYYGTFGIGINYLSMPSIARVDNTGTRLPSSFTPTDVCIIISYGNYLENGIDLGGSLKYITSNIAGKSATAFALDVGAKKKLPEYTSEIGILIRNLGTELKFNKDGDPLPMVFKLGGKYVLSLDGYIDLETYEIENGMNFLLDLNYANDNGFFTNFGAEYIGKVGKKTIVGRLGYKTGLNGLDSLAGFTCGFGLKFQEYNIDYALAPYGELGLTHRISVSYEILK